MRWARIPCGFRWSAWGAIGIIVTARTARGAPRLTTSLYLRCPKSSRLQRRRSCAGPASQATHRVQRRAGVARARAISEDEIVPITSAVLSEADEGVRAEDREEDELPTSRLPDTALGEHSHSEPYVPDIVIINRYGRHGSLGLHQDKDESAASLAAGTPIVSISLGDSCVFVVGPPTVQVGGTPPPPSECQYVRLHSGDAIVFGGPSRLIWHGVKSVFSGSAPGFLRLPEKPCRLNLTMRRF